MAAGSAFNGAAVRVPRARAATARRAAVPVRAELGAPVPAHHTNANLVASVQVAQVANTAAPPVPAGGACRAARGGACCGARRVRAADGRRWLFQGLFRCWAPACWRAPPWHRC